MEQSLRQRCADCGRVSPRIQIPRIFCGRGRTRIQYFSFVVDADDSGVLAKICGLTRTQKFQDPHISGLRQLHKQNTDASGCSESEDANIATDLSMM